MQTEPRSADLGNFYYLIPDRDPPAIDLLACRPWGRLEPHYEDYGIEERFLPSFYLIKLLFNRDDKWEFPEAFAEKIAGPLTVTFVYINIFDAERTYLAAKNFESSMKGRSVTHYVSTQFIIPGLLAAVSSYEPTEPHQVLIVSQIFDREPIKNPEYKSA